MPDSDSPAVRFRRLLNTMMAAGPVWFQELHDPAQTNGEPLGAITLSLPALATLCGPGIDPTEGELTDWLNGGALDWISARFVEEVPGALIREFHEQADVKAPPTPAQELIEATRAHRASRNSRYRGLAGLRLLTP